MKLQGFSIIFALVAIPLILVLTYYIQLQVDTIRLQTEYDSKLLDATHDAMSSFELNTANEDLSTVADSLRTIIEASNNVFFNTLSTNFGLSNASRSFVDPYIPAILYTLYDGYYISAPTQVLEFCKDEDGKAISVGDKGVEKSGNYYVYKKDSDKYLKHEDLIESTDYGQLLYLARDHTDEYTTKIADAQLNTKNVLKTYMPYSARYKGNSNGKNFDITIIYTLDNYVTIEGYIDSIYYTKSGYLIPSGVVTIEASDPNENLKEYNESDIQNYIQQGKKVTIKINDNGNISTISSGYDHISDLDDSSIKYSSYSELNDYLNKLNNHLHSIQDLRAANKPFDNVRMKDLQQAINNTQYALDQMSAVIYYTKASIFSNWVQENLNNPTDGIQILENNISQISGQNYTSIKGTENVTYDFSNSDRPIFDTNGNNNSGITEIPDESTFYSHKLNVIRNSIQYNLNLAMSTYNNQTSRTYSYEMPVMLNDEWNLILKNPSIVSFMQGYSCGLKIYNNYMVVASTNNEISVSPKNIFYVEKDNFSDESTEYHRIDCPQFTKNYKNVVNSKLRSFSSKEVKYDKIYDGNFNYMQYIYNHKNLACYDCINDGNYNETNIFENSDYLGLQAAYYLAIGKERNNLYKMNAIEPSEGYEIVFDKNQGIGKSSTLPLNKIKSIEIVLGTIHTRSSNSEEITYNFEVDSKPLEKVGRNTISSNSTSDVTINLRFNPNSFKNSSGKFSLNDLKVIQESSNSTYLNSPDEPIADANRKQEIFKSAVKYIKVIYK